MPSFKDLNDANNTMAQINNAMDDLQKNLNNKTINTAEASEQLNKLIQQYKEADNAYSSFRKNNDDLNNSMQNVNKTIAEISEKISALFKNMNNIPETEKNIIQMVNNINLIKESVNATSSEVAKLKDVDMSNPQLEQIKKQFNDMNDAVKEFIETAKLSDIKPENYSQISNAMEQFAYNMKDKISSSLNIANMIGDSEQEQKIKSQLDNYIGIIVETMHLLPDKMKNEIKDGINIVPNIKVDNDAILKELNDKLQQNIDMNVKVKASLDNSGGVAMSDPAAEARTSKNFQEEQLQIMKDKLNQFGSQNDKQSAYIDKNTKSSQNSFDDIHKYIHDMLSKYASNSYSIEQKKDLSKAGLTEDALKSMLTEVNKAQKVSNIYSNQYGDLRKLMGEYKKSVNDGNPNQDIAEQIHSQIKYLINNMDELSKISNNFGNIYNNKNSNIDKLPKETQEMLKSLSASFKDNSEIISSLTLLSQTFSTTLDSKLQESLKNAKNAFDGLSDSANSFAKNNSSGDSSVLDKFLGKAKDFMKGFGKFGNNMDAVGLGVGIPYSVSTAKGYAKDVVGYYKEFGQMDASTAMAFGQVGYNNTYAPAKRQYTENRQMGMDYFKSTHGLVGEQDYSQMYNSLLTQVGMGHYGIGGDKTAGIEALSGQNGLSSVALDVSKVYGISTSEMSNDVKSFYKDLNMSADQTGNTLMKLSTIATEANVPVGQYIQQVSTLAKSFKDLGLNSNDAINLMNSFVMQGMSLDTASSLTKATGTALTSMGKGDANSMYWGMVSGGATDIWNAGWKSVDRWDEKGNEKKGATDYLAGSLDSQLSVYKSIYSGNSDMQHLGIYQLFKQKGIDDKSADMLTNEYLKNGNSQTFKDKLSQAEDDSNSVKLKGQDQLESSLKNAGNSQDELTKAINDNKSLQQQLANTNKGLLDYIGKTLDKTINTLGKDIVDADSNLTKSITNLINSNSLLSKVLQEMQDNPIWFAIIAIAAKLGGSALSSVAKKAGGSILKSAAKKVTGSLGKKAATTAAEDVTKNAAKTASKSAIKKAATKAAQAKGAAKTVAAKKAARAAAKKAAETATEDVAKKGAESAGKSLAKKGAEKVGGTILKKVPIVGIVAGGAINAADSYAEGDSLGEGALKTTLGVVGGALSTFPGLGTAAGLAVDVGGTTLVDKLFGTGMFKKEKAAKKSTATKKVAKKITSSKPASTKKPASSSSNKKETPANASTTAINSILTEIKKISTAETSMNTSLKDIKSKNNTLLTKGNSLQTEIYKLNEKTYKELLKNMKDQYDKINDIYNVNNSGFKDANKKLDDVYSLEQSIYTSILQSSSGGSGGTSASDLSGAGWDKVNKWDNFINEASSKYGVDANLIKAVMMQESGGDNLAKNGSGAMGLMQVTSGSASDNGFGGKDLMDPETNIMAGAAELAKDLKNNGNDITKALAAYNAGQGNVDSGAYKNFKETQDYIKKVPGYYEQLTNGAMSLSSSSTKATYMSANTSSRQNLLSAKSEKVEMSSNKNILGSISESSSSTSKILQTIADGTAFSGIALGGIGNVAAAIGNASKGILSSVTNNSASSTTNNSGDGSSSDSTNSSQYESAAPMLGQFGSQEYTNRSQGYNPLLYKSSLVNDRDTMTSSKDEQGVARGVLLAYQNSTDKKAYGNLPAITNNTDVTNPAYYKSSANPKFAINVNVDSNAQKADFDKMAGDLQNMITEYVKFNMNSTTQVAQANYYRSNS